MKKTTSIDENIKTLLFAGFEKKTSVLDGMSYYARQMSLNDNAAIEFRIYFSELYGIQLDLFLVDLNSQEQRIWIGREGSEQVPLDRPVQELLLKGYKQVAAFANALKEITWRFPRLFAKGKDSTVD